MLPSRASRCTSLNADSSLSWSGVLPGRGTFGARDMSREPPDMRHFWDRRAREDAFHFVDNRLPYRSTDHQVFWEEGARDLETLLRIAGVSVDPTDAVLEIGCGVGRLTRRLAAEAQAVTALDVSAEMIARAESLNPELANVRWLLGDGTTLEGVGNATMDGCVSHVVFQHIPDPAVTLGYVREIGRVLRPGGWAAFQVSNDPAVHRAGSHGTRASRLTRRLKAALGLAPRGQDDPAWLGSSVELRDLRSVAEDGGMAIEEVAGEGTQFCIIRARRLARP